ncbi:hypothetical protein HAX54_002022 [Datura stramonium]|uniref:Uncharacterized protein n=1 Tax=Datura stramonium TaxID=4076 RepID=A0ABS8T392_DATST|nr:hypothetical protein [Datura stramonium]
MESVCETGLFSIRSYFERSTPYGRVPFDGQGILFSLIMSFSQEASQNLFLLAAILLKSLHPKFMLISGFAERFSGLMSLRSVDLSPAQLMSVAWKQLCLFCSYGHEHDGIRYITFLWEEPLKTCQHAFTHSTLLSSSFQDMDLDDDMESAKRKKREYSAHLLPPFGLGTYKMVVMCGFGKNGNKERVSSLFSVVYSWLKQLASSTNDFQSISWAFWSWLTIPNDGFALQPTNGLSTGVPFLNIGSEVFSGLLLLVA